jgi:2',3'-cyclic-nucleotide 2'-phosphodiesterase (5'-nucleotidase family)
MRARKVCIFGGVAALVLGLCAGSCGNKSAESEHRAAAAELTLLYSSDLLGHVRSCGCVVKDMGGLPRRATYVDGVRSSVENLIQVDAGDALGPELDYTQNEADLTFEAFTVMGLDAFTPGETDFVFGLPFLQERAKRVTFDFLAANVVDPSTGQPIFGKTYTIKELKGGLRVGITGIIDEGIRFPAYIDASSFKVLPAAETLERLMPELKKKADFLVLLSHAGIERSKAIASEVPGFDLVVVGHGEPIIKDLEKAGGATMLATGGAGQFIGRIDLQLSGAGRTEKGEMNLVPIEDTIKLSPAITELFKKYGVALTDKAAGRH